MDLQESQSKTLELLAKNEETVSRLYLAYASRFPEMSEFWSELAEEEKLHARWIRILKQISLEGKLFFEPDRFSSASIRSFSSDVEGKIPAATNTGFKLIDALSIAMSIEESLVESKYFETFEADSMDLKRSLKDLDTATREHAQRLREVLDIHSPKNAH